MLNLTNPVKYTEPEEMEILRIKRAHKGAKGSDLWNASSKQLKKHISKHTLYEQRCRCAYCGSLLIPGIAEIEHIVPKGKHPYYCYEPYNLVTSCKTCNAPRYKGQNDTIETTNKIINYPDNHFLIVHPYYDNPDEHIRYLDDEKIFFDYNNCTDQGLFTIRLFHWHEDWARIMRAYHGNRMEEIIDDDLIALIAETMTYQR